MSQIPKFLIFTSSQTFEYQINDLKDTRRCQHILLDLSSCSFLLFGLERVGHSHQIILSSRVSLSLCHINLTCYWSSEPFWGHLHPAPAVTCLNLLLHGGII